MNITKEMEGKTAQNRDVVKQGKPISKASRGRHDPRQLAAGAGLPDPGTGSRRGEAPPDLPGSRARRKGQSLEDDARSWRDRGHDVCARGVPPRALPPPRRGDFLPRVGAGGPAMRGRKGTGADPTCRAETAPKPSCRAAWMWKQRDAAAETFYRRIPGRTGLPQKAIVAVARKLAITLWRLSASPLAAA